MKSPLREGHKKSKDSLGEKEAWAKWEKGYMDRTHKFKGTKFERKVTPEENRKEMNAERGEFKYDSGTGTIRLRKTDDADQPIEMRSPLDSRGSFKDHDMGFEGWKAHKQTMHGIRDHGGPSMKSPLQMVGIQSPLNKISGPCKAAAKKKFKVWPSAYASGWGVRCTKAGGPGKMGKSKKK